MGRYIPDMNEIHHLKADIRAWNQEIKDYENDYTILSNQKSVLAQISVVCENNSYLTECLDSSISNIETLSKEVKFTGFNELFDFEELKSDKSLVGSFKNSNTNYITELENLGKLIDEAQIDIADNIQKLQNKIRTTEMRINQLLYSPTIYTE